MTDIKDFGRTSLITHTTGLIERMEKCTMNNHLFKLKKDGETVGYLQLKGDVPSPKSAAERPLTAIDGLVWYNAEKTIMSLQDIEIQWDTAHLFVTKDKNGKDVFEGDSVLHDSYPNEKSGKVIFDEDLTYKVRWTLTKHKSFIRSDVIELIEDRDND